MDKRSLTRRKLKSPSRFWAGGSSYPAIRPYREEEKQRCEEGARVLWCISTLVQEVLYSPRGLATSHS